jgi:mannose-6-phosphate isomerase
MSFRETNIIRIQGKIKHYDWGGNEFIPDLLGFSPESNVTYAEYWLGNHPEGKFKVLSGEIHSESSYPFLLKVLEVKKMLSIQAHPNKKEAETGFTAENIKKIPLDSPLRIFKDDNHKPELMVALSDFWLLHGFVDITVFKRKMEKYGIDNFNACTSIKEAFSAIAEWNDSALKATLEPFIESISSVDFNSNEIEFWIKKAFQSYSFDRGLLMMPMLNLVYLKKGEAIFQDAGIPHAYLSGINVEIMSSSDNVFRGGLTNKHVDAELLKKHLNFDTVVPMVIKEKCVSDTESTYQTACTDFQLNMIRLNNANCHFESTAEGIQLYLMLDGEIEIEKQQFKKGDSFLIHDKSAFQITSPNHAVLIKAFKP